VIGPGGASAAFEALLDRSGQVAILLVNERLRIVGTGRSAEALAERQRVELVGMSLIAAFNSVSLDALAREALAAGAPRSGEAELGPLGSRSFSAEAVPLPDGGLVLVLHEITSQRRAERVRRDFIANISHELRTPLASIKLLAETLSSGAADDPGTARDFSTQIEREVDHLAQLVDELLDLSMIESGAIQLAIEALDPDGVVRSVAERIGPVAERREIGVRTLGPTPGEDVRASADPARLGQALLNLAHNAVKYSQPHGEVRIGWEARERSVRFTVADDGIGIPRSHQARIFERFYKVDRARSRGTAEDSGRTSAGLGLAIVRHIAEAHGGRVGVTSEEGVGSTFWLEVPRAG
jgi:two-component system phosphate regulon sensor histidine kinase PhoR